VNNCNREGLALGLPASATNRLHQFQRLLDRHMLIARAVHDKKWRIA
jgi:hypothetical protein